MLLIFSPLKCREGLSRWGFSVLQSPPTVQKAVWRPRIAPHDPQKIWNIHISSLNYAWMDSSDSQETSIFHPDNQLWNCFESPETPFHPWTSRTRLLTFIPKLTVTFWSCCSEQNKVLLLESASSWRLWVFILNFYSTEETFTLTGVKDPCQACSLWINRLSWKKS